ncbi:MAG TPA: alpha/beta hydrolase [Caulobacteraceae bacterium]|jgi:pimeloyl-ACP methyl ester carboxylesterase
MTAPRLFRTAWITAAVLLAIGGALLGARAASAADAAGFRSDRITVEVVGEGPDVVLIPGLASSRAVWDGLVERLRPSHRLHLVQVRGFAGLPVEGVPATAFEPLVGEVGRYIAEARLERPALVGHSMGGAASLRLAQTRPELVGRLVIVDSLPFYTVLMAPTATAETATPFAQQFEAQLLGATDESFAAMQAASARGLALNAAAQGRIVAWSVASDRRLVARAIRELMTTDLRQGLDQVRAPTTVPRTRRWAARPR